MQRSCGIRQLKIGSGFARLRRRSANRRWGSFHGHVLINGCPRRQNDAAFSRTLSCTFSRRVRGFFKFSRRFSRRTFWGDTSLFHRDMRAKNVYFRSRSNPVIFALYRDPCARLPRYSRQVAHRFGDFYFALFWVHEFQARAARTSGTVTLTRVPGPTDLTL